MQKFTVITGPPQSGKTNYLKRLSTSNKNAVITQYIPNGARMSWTVSNNNIIIMDCVPSIDALNEMIRRIRLYCHVSCYPNLKVYIAIQIDVTTKTGIVEDVTVLRCKHREPYQNAGRVVTVDDEFDLRNIKAIFTSIFAPRQRYADITIVNGGNKASRHNYTFPLFRAARKPREIPEGMYKGEIDLIDVDVVFIHEVPDHDCLHNVVRDIRRFVNDPINEGVSVPKFFITVTEKLTPSMIPAGCKYVSAAAAYVQQSGRGIRQTDTFMDWQSNEIKWDRKPIFFGATNHSHAHIFQNHDDPFFDMMLGKREFIRQPYGPVVVRYTGDDALVVRAGEEVVVRSVRGGLEIHRTNVGNYKPEFTGYLAKELKELENYLGKTATTTRTKKRKETGDKTLDKAIKQIHRSTRGNNPKRHITKAIAALEQKFNSLNK